MSQAYSRIAVGGAAMLGWLLLSGLAVVGGGQSLLAQEPSKSLSTAPSKGLSKPLGKSLGGNSQDSGGSFSSLRLPGSNSAGGLTNPVSFTATYHVEQNGQRGRVEVTATLEDEYSIYSTTQPKGGPLPTFIAAQDANVSIVGPFVPDREPKLVFDEEGFEGIRIEKFYGIVTWTAPINFKNAVADTTQIFTLTIDCQVCKKACIPVSVKDIEAKFASFYTSEKSSGGPYRDPSDHAVWTASLSPSVASPGSTVMLELTGTPDENYHLYPLQIDDPETNQRTLIALTQKGTMEVSPPMASSQPVKIELGEGTLSSTYHNGPVTWTIPIQIPENRQEGVYPIAGIVGYQTCTMESCDAPVAFEFSGEINVGKATNEKAEQSALLAMKEIDFDTAIAAHKTATWTQATPPAGPKIAMAFLPLLSAISLAMLGGLILNFMPCVLPVIGLKVMSFVSEGSGDPRRTSILNLWYSAGLISVFMILAAVTIFIRIQFNETLGWGQQMQVFGLRLGLVVLLFMMALSFLGVWEIPIPGFATSGKSVELTQKEGPFGAFCKGMITTVVATPCSGPLLGSVFALLLTQPTWVIAVIYLAIGIGMAMPFLLIAVYPQTLRFLPKPGMWMETLKQVLAFPLLLSVVWFLATINTDYRIAALVLLVFVGFGCWLVGRVPAYAELQPKILAWCSAIAITTVAGIFSFQYLGPQDELIQWQPYNENILQQSVAAGQPVLIDFTATWCAACQVNRITAIETDQVAALIEQNNILPMLADWTDKNLTVGGKLRELGSNSIPVLAIYPAGNSKPPIVLRDSLLEGMVVEAINEAVADGSAEAQVSKTKIDKSTIAKPVSRQNKLTTPLH